MLQNKNVSSKDFLASVAAGSPMIPLEAQIFKRHLFAKNNHAGPWINLFKVLNLEITVFRCFF